MRFASRTALVTGATGAIGGAIASALADEGATVHAMSRQDRIADRYVWHTIDLDDEASVAAAAKDVAGIIKRLDVLVHAAGYYSTGSLSDTPVAELDRLWRINTRAPWALTRALLPALSAAKGTVIFMNSSVWSRSRGGLGAYSASKYALRAIADALRDEVSPIGVRVQSVYPGRTAGKIQERIAVDDGRPYDPARLIQPTEIAEAVLHGLAASRSSEITDLHIRPSTKPED